MNLNEVNRGIKRNKKRKRVGRGPGSGVGKTSGRGHKGQQSRAGASAHPIFQGGAMPLVRRVPKRGFNNRWATVVAAVNVSDLDSNFNEGDEINPDALRKKSLIGTHYEEVKILGKGELTKKLTVSAHRFSQTAKQKIESAGGTAVVLAGKTPVSVKQKKKKQSAASA